MIFIDGSGYFVAYAEIFRYDLFNSRKCNYTSWNWILFSRYPSSCILLSLMAASQSGLVRPSLTNLCKILRRKSAVLPFRLFTTTQGTLADNASDQSPSNFHLRGHNSRAEPQSNHRIQPRVRRDPAASPQSNNPSRQPGYATTVRNNGVNDAIGVLLSPGKIGSEGNEGSYIQRQNAELYRFHVFCTKHNTHITLTNSKRDPILSLSTGNLGFRKANRGTYDAAYQLANYVLGRMQEQGWSSKIQFLEVVLRGYGVGREAVSKSLTGVEGRMVRGSVVRVSDGTRLKFGGTRSRKIRRLG